MFTYVDATRKEHTSSLEDLLKKSTYTVLYFYPKNDTPGCTIEAKEFTNLIEQFAAVDTQVVGVSKDSIESHCSFIEKYTLGPSYLSDPELMLHKQFDARGKKNMYGKISEGVIRSTVILDTAGTILKRRGSVRAAGHAKKVLDWAQNNLSTQ